MHISVCFFFSPAGDNPTGAKEKNVTDCYSITFLIFVVRLGLEPRLY